MKNHHLILATLCQTRWNSPRIMIHELDIITTRMSFIVSKQWREMKATRITKSRYWMCCYLRLFIKNCYRGLGAKETHPQGPQKKMGIHHRWEGDTSPQKIKCHYLPLTNIKYLPLSKKKHKISPYMSLTYLLHLSTK